MLLDDAGRMICETGYEIPGHFPGVGFDVVQVMPNHLQGIVVLCVVGTDLCVCPFSMPGNGRAQRPAPTTLSDATE